MLLVGKLRHRRVTPFTVRTATPFADPHNPRRWTTRSTLILHGPSLAQTDPRSAGWANSGGSAAARRRAP